MSSWITETCGCGATWKGPGAYRDDRMRFREAHEACRSAGAVRQAILTEVEEALLSDAAVEAATTALCHEAKEGEVDEDGQRFQGGELILDTRAAIRAALASVKGEAGE